MAGYICIAMLEDPPYNMILGTTEEEPEQWLDGLPLPSHLLCHEYFQNAQAVERECLIKLRTQGIDARSDKAFTAQANEVMLVYLLVRDSFNNKLILDANNDEEHAQDEGQRLFELAVKLGRELDDPETESYVLLKKAAEAGHKLALDEVIMNYDYNLENLAEVMEWINQNRIILDGDQWYKLAETFEFDDPQYIAVLKKAAEAGHEQALEEVIDSYCNEKNLAEAVVWIDQSKINLNADAWFELAERLNYDDPQKLKIFTKLADAGHSNALINLAESYVNGTDTEQNITVSLLMANKALSLLKDTENAELGYVYYLIANIYENGCDTVIPDLKKAFKYYQQASRLGCVFAYYFLSNAYLYGEGVKKDLNEALQWAYQDIDTGSIQGYTCAAQCFEEANMKSQLESLWVRCFLENADDDLENVIYWYVRQVSSKQIAAVHPPEITRRFPELAEKLSKINSKTYKSTIQWLESH